MNLVSVLHHLHFFFTNISLPPLLMYVHLRCFSIVSKVEEITTHLIRNVSQIQVLLGAFVIMSIVCVSVRPTVCVSVSLCVYVFMCLSIVCVSVYPSVCVSVHVSVSQSGLLSVCVSVSLSSHSSSEVMQYDSWSYHLMPYHLRIS